MRKTFKRFAFPISVPRLCGGEENEWEERGNENLGFVEEEKAITCSQTHSQM